MGTPHNILIIHPGAIGDVMLAMPVAATLKYNFPDARLTYLTHPSLVGLVKLSQAVDAIIEFRKETGFMAQRVQILACRPDLIVDLSGSTRSRLLTLFTGAKVVRYQKQSANAVPIQHAVENFLATLGELPLKLPAQRFPTIEPPFSAVQEIREQLVSAGLAGKALVGLVPGVGNLRSHRAWTKEGWQAVAKTLVCSEELFPVLIGGQDEAESCRELAAVSGAYNLAGKLSLVQTAAVLKLCRAVVSGDTGPAHMAVAVGTPVIGLYGPTFPERSGPYGCGEYLVSSSHHCRCHSVKRCRLTSQHGPGDCMRRISADEVLAKLECAIAGVVGTTFQVG